jgi:hypothetical protein
MRGRPVTKLLRAYDDALCLGERRHDDNQYSRLAD